MFSKPWKKIRGGYTAAMKSLLLPLWLCCGAVLVRAELPPLRHLFLDPATLPVLEQVALRVNPPERRELVIQPDQPWEQLMISFYLTVLDDGGKLRMWYICRDKANKANVAYAESGDGTHWTKPNLGIVKYEGSTSNNLVGLTSLEGVVCRDPHGPPEARYVYVTHLPSKGLVRFYSPDGLRWRHDAAPLLRLGADTQNVTFWDERLQKYVLYLRGWERGPDKKLYRKVVRAELPDLTTPLAIGPTSKSLRMWGKDKVAVIGTEFPTVFAADASDPPDTDVYNLSALPYPPDPRWYVGFPSIFQRDRHMSDGRLHIQFTGSRDGVAWQRYDRAAYVALRTNENMVFMGTGLIVRGDELWQFGTSFASRHGDREARQKKTDGAIYRYVQRLDGFISADFGAAPGRCVTAPVTVDGGRLLLNVDTGAQGELRVGLQDAEGKVLAGCAAEECAVVRTNSTHAEVIWKDHNMAALKGQKVKLVFTGMHTKLYSFRFE